MRYYIKQNNQWQQLQVEIEPKYVKAFDTTNDTLSCVLQANTVKDAYAPMTPFKIEEDVNNTTETTILWVINDTVDVFSVRPLKYKHTLSIVQFRYFLNKHLVRNTVFNQPRKNKLELYGAVSNFNSLGEGMVDNVPYYSSFWAAIPKSTAIPIPGVMFWGDKLALNNHSKIKHFSYKVKIFAGVTNNVSTSDAGKWVELTELNPDFNVQFVDTAYFEIVDLNNSNYSIAKIYIAQSALRGEIVDDFLSDDLNEYILEHRNALLAIKYWDSRESYFNFVEPIESQFPTTDPDANAKRKYGYMTCQLFINLEIYNYTMYDVLEVLLKQYRLQSATFGYKKEALFNLPSEDSELGGLLRNTYPKDTMNFTQATFYDALTEIFRYYDAGFKFDENKNLQIEYYNNPEKQVNPTLVGRQVSHSDKNFNNGRVAYYQNAVLNVNIPRITVRTQGFGVPASGDFGILLEKPIYDIGKVYLDVWSNSFKPFLSGYSFVFDRMKLDITNFIVNDNEYTVLDKADPDGISEQDDLTLKYQVTTLHFARGGNFISLSETYKSGGGLETYNFNNVIVRATCKYFGFGTYTVDNVISDARTFTSPSANDFKSQVFSIEYLTMNNGRSEVQTVTKKYDGQQIVNQNDGLIDLNKLGLNILGESLKDGEPVLTGSCTITDWASRIKEGDYFVDNGVYWVANVVNYTEISPGKFRCSVEFSKNFNALALRVASDKEKRLTNVSSENAVVSEDNYIDFIYLFNPNDWSSYNGQKILLDEQVLASMISQTFKDDALYGKNDVKFGVLTSFDFSYNVITYGSRVNGNLPQAKNRYVPLLKYGLGNCICFEGQFKDAMNAGNQLTVTSGWFGTNKYFSSAALYTDDDGWADIFDYALCDLTADGEVNDIGNFPVIEESTYSTYVQELGRIDKLIYYKKPNEIFALNYEWCFLVVENKLNKMFIGNKFINENFFTNKEAIKSKRFYIRYLTPSEQNNSKYSMLDTKGIGDSYSTIEEVIVNIDTTNHKLRIGFRTSYGFLAKIWAVVDENNDIYFASNEAASFSDSETIYHLGIFTWKTRKDL